MSQISSLPTFGEVVPGEGGRLGGIMRGHVIDGVRQPDYAIIIPDTPPIELMWGKYVKELKGAASLTDGFANTLVLVNNKSPAAIYAAALEYEGHRDYYLPSRGELWALRMNVPELFEQESYWSSTQSSSFQAFIQNFNRFESQSIGKSYAFRVRACRRISIKNPLALPA